MNKVTIQLLNKKQLGTKLYKFVFNKPFNFEAGQFISVHVGGSIKRYYSIASPPQESHINLYVTTMPGGPGSRFFEKLEVGDRMDLVGPLGKFIYRRKVDACFVATGTGVAPLISIIKDQLYKQNQAELYLLYGVRYEDNVMIEEDLQELSEKYPNFKYNITVSRPTKNWNGLTGRVTEHLKDVELSRYKDYYICGVKDMVLDVKNFLLDQGIEESSIFSELY